MASPEPFNMLFFIITILADVITGDRAPEYCWPETFNATCAKNEVILMTHAQYGRMRMGRCLTSPYDIGCAADVLTQIDRRCSGRHSCSISIPDTHLHSIQPCSKDMTTYLEASYKCLKVSHGGETMCQASRPLQAPPSKGFLANIVSSEVGHGTPACPWVVRAQKGQRINVTVWDFAVAERVSQQDNMCVVYAVIHDGFRTTDLSLCGTKARITNNVYLSETSFLEIELRPVMLKDGPAFFLLQYEAVGCVDMKAPSAGWYRRHGNVATLGCNYTTEVWQLKCIGSAWVGKLGNCSKGLQTIKEELSDDAADFPYGLLVAVTIGVVLGVMIGMTMLAFVLVAQRRRKAKRRAVLQHNSTDVLDVYSDDPSRGAHLPDYSSYAHVWELRQLTHAADAENAAIKANQQQQQQQQQQQMKFVPCTFHTNTFKPGGGGQLTYDCPRLHSNEQCQADLVVDVANVPTRPPRSGSIPRDPSREAPMGREQSPAKVQDQGRIEDDFKL